MNTTNTLIARRKLDKFKFFSPIMLTKLMVAVLLTAVGSTALAQAGSCTIAALNPGGNTLVIPPNGIYDSADAAAVSQQAATILGHPEAVNGIKLISASTTSVSPREVFAT